MWLFHALLYITTCDLSIQGAATLFLQPAPPHQAFPRIAPTQGLAPLAGFNVDVAQTWITPSGAPFVLSSLLHQDSSTNQTWLLVTSPMTNESAGPLHRCSFNLNEISCQTVEHAHIPKKKHQGVTVVRNQHGVLVCIQVTTRKPHSLSPELTGNCNLLDSSLQFQTQTYFSNFKNLLPDAPVDAGDCYWNRKSNTEGNEHSARGRRALKEVDEEEEEEEEEAGTEIAFILDGSGSINIPDFEKAKDFISNMMKDIYERCFECSFALVQYGGVIQTEFDLLDSQDEMATLAKVKNISQVKSVTKTASAMQHVLDTIFTPSRGSREKATKIMVVLTDGDIFMDPLNLTTVINSPEMQGVERFAIGVGEAFENEKSDKELKLIASDPDEKHAFKVTNYSALSGLLSKLQQSIIHMEGARGEDLHCQLAQVGFSAQILNKEQVLLGAVGAFNWSGGVLVYNMSSGEGRFLNQSAADAKTAQYSYLGYSVAVLHKTHGLSYVAGAPQHKHRGTVFELQKVETGTTFLSVLEGEQMGSYFGSELCPVDINMDGTTDLLLVAAPFYHIHGEEGRVYVYRLDKQNGSFSFVRTLSGLPRFKDARFGFAMAAIGDISQDKLTDVAIGAPLEDFRADSDNSFGSVYIYNGRQQDLSSSYSQRISASEMTAGLHYFGMSLAGGFDISGDGLADITVGTLGQATVLRSRPVVHLKVTMKFTPQELPIRFNGTVNATLCFEISSGTPATKTGLQGTSLNFTLDVDVMKHRRRLKYSDGKTSLSLLREWPKESQLCEPLKFHPVEGELIEDYFFNIHFNISYQLKTPKAIRNYAHSILDHYTEPSAIFQLPYEKTCKNKTSCNAELQLDFTISQQNLVIGDTKELIMNLNVTNSGEDSYMTILTVQYPRILQFKRIQTPTSLHIQCDDPQQDATAMNCKIGHPVFKRSSADIMISWQLEENVFSNSTEDITVTTTSSNIGSPVSKSATMTFKRAFTAMLNKPLVMYMNTSKSLLDHKEFIFNIRGDNHYDAQFQLQICVPIKIHGFQVVNVMNYTQSTFPQCKSRCSKCREDSATASDAVIWCKMLFAAAMEVSCLLIRSNSASQRDPLIFFPSVPHSGFSAFTESTELQRADLTVARVTLTASAGTPAAGLLGEAGELNREALVPSSSQSLGWLHTLSSGLRRPGWLSEKGGGPYRPHGRKSGSSGSSEATDCKGPLLLASLLLLLLLKKRFRSGGGNHCVAARPGRRRGPQPPTVPYVRKSRLPGRGNETAITRTRLAVQIQAPREFKMTFRRLPAGLRTSRVLAPVFARALSCGSPRSRVCETVNPLQKQTSSLVTPPSGLLIKMLRYRFPEVLPHVEEWDSVNCNITSGQENVTVAAELILSHSERVIKTLRDLNELHILGRIIHDETLYQRQNAENNKTQITVIFLKDETPVHFLPVIIGSSVGGFLVLIVIIVILVKCGFFKRKYQQLNLESMRRTQLKSEDLLPEENSEHLLHPSEKTAH
ncbi:PREDICTED: integrin alpha-E [Chrysochloris asiatica]|uniref:Integrin alpha-E n=1 Tax=Chrysochloris asiatica TaxID=185453 RepID=A0A9B0WMX8_CHRAS|nr:PREDICTED: integrin alpha-E [Chrysochloris asiatica]